MSDYPASSNHAVTPATGCAFTAVRGSNPFVRHSIPAVRGATNPSIPTRDAGGEFGYLDFSLELAADWFLSTFHAKIELKVDIVIHEGVIRVHRFSSDRGRFQFETGGFHAVSN
ncbi:MAG: hypothetical protein P9F19_05525 [Candidatus Contendobacter sp.]|nr:hypothetical protein [Candidatus Contendobacter sp.]MDG4556836.1 hypothetical protein [Candidatus Contendobacter sp.]